MGIWKAATKEEALLQLAAFKGKYQRRYPEAVRSLMEDEEHLLTFYAFPPVMHRYIRTTNAIESFFSNVRQRTDQIDTFTRRYQLPDDRLGGHAGHPCAKDSRQLTVKHCLELAEMQPAAKGDLV
jgi:hypothetical protein